MNFCEDCGDKLSPGVAFCENCGARIPLEQQSLSTQFKKTDVDGIVYTNLPLLASQLNKSPDSLFATIQQFIASSASYGINYVFVDASSNFSSLATVKDHLKLIRSKVEEFQSRYLFILGSSSVIPSMVWKNYASTAKDDPDISSDLPYATLDGTNPFDGPTYNYDKILQVGRLPNVDLENYFSNLELFRREKRKIETFSLSAKVWFPMTEHIYQTIASGPRVLSSPHCTVMSVHKKIPETTNLFLFNLHGHDATKYWYGQDGSSFPEAVEPSSFDRCNFPYFLAVEACYGAAYEGRPIHESILLSTLSGKCISFLGSSRIAFGVPAPSMIFPKGSCADIICGEFLRNLKTGMSAGTSLNMARKKLMQSNVDAEDIKTLAEFSLYGDPTATITGQAHKGFVSSSSIVKGIGGFHIPQPDIRQAIRMELVSVEQRILESIERMINSQYTTFKGITPQFYKNTSRTDMLRAVLCKQDAIGPQYLIMDVSPLGQVKGVLESK